ncbi:VOC family protein [Sciscionella marina]|uniref:VOC family protein n=1 Tax=Sciscionella marina TaxID=508770 RepID=UPI000378099F|nr:VOC family protein [Sciscionella marina]
MTKDYPIGTTVWQELEVRRAEGLAEFYRAVLGWELELDGARGRFLLEGELVAGLVVRPELPAAQTGWRAYLGAEDLDAATSRAVAAGAVLQDRDKPLGVPGKAVELTDPFGAWFGLAEPEPGAAVPPAPAIGRWAFVDPSNFDMTTEVAFQEALFPGQTVDSSEGSITIFRDANGLALRGSYEIHEEVRAVLPPHWLPWISVLDQAKATEIAAAHGGRVNTVDNVLSFAVWGVVADPQGAEFKVLQMTKDAI